MITYYTFDEKEKVLQQHDAYESKAWIHAENPTIEEKKLLIEKLHLEPGHINDALDINEVPRFEVEQKGLYLFLRFPFAEETTTVTLPFLLVITEEHIVTIALHSPSFINQTLEKKMTFTTSHKEKLLVLILSEITSLYSLYLNKINKEIRQIRSKIEKIKNKNIVQFVSFEEVLNDFRPSLVGTDNVLRSLLSGRHLKFEKLESDKIEDVHLSNRQIIESCEDTLDTIRNIREAYTTILTNNLNTVIKLFTSLTVILTIPTMIASLFGMNVSLPFAHHPNAFIGIIILITGISVGLLFIFQKNDWF